MGKHLLNEYESNAWCRVSTSKTWKFSWIPCLLDKLNLSDFLLFLI